MSITVVYKRHRRKRYPDVVSGPGSLRKPGEPRRQLTAIGSLKDLKVWRDPVKYGYAVGRIKVRESALLNRQRIGRLIEADFAEALHILEEVDYGDYVKQAGVAADVDVGLLRFLEDLYDFLTEITPSGSHIRDWLLARYDFHNLKVYLKERCCDGGLTGITLELGTLPPEVLRAGLDNPLLLPEHMRDALLEVLVLPEPSSQQVDSILDRRLLEYRLSLARLERSGFMVQFTRSSIDIANLKALLRAKNLGKEPGWLETVLAAGGELGKKRLLALAQESIPDIMHQLSSTKYAAKLLKYLDVRDDQVGLTEYDRRADDLLMTELHRAQRLVAGVEPILGYVRGRENDVMVLRIILMGKLHNLAPETIEEHLRVLYGERETG